MKRRAEHGKQNVAKTKQKRSPRKRNDLETKSEINIKTSKPDSSSFKQREMGFVKSSTTTTNCRLFLESSSREQILGEDDSPKVEKYKSFDVVSRVITDETALKSSYQVRNSGDMTIDSKKSYGDERVTELRNTLRERSRMCESRGNEDQNEREGNERCRTNIYEVSERSNTRKYEASERSLTNKYEASERNHTRKYEASERSRTNKYAASERNHTMKYEASERSHTNKYEASGRSRTNKYEASERSRINKYETSERSPRNKYEASELSHTNKYEASERSLASNYESGEQSLAKKYKAAEGSHINKYLATENQRLPPDYSNSSTSIPATGNLNVGNLGNVKGLSVEDLLKLAGERTQSTVVMQTILSNVQHQLNLISHVASNYLRTELQKSTPSTTSKPSTSSQDDERSGSRSTSHEDVSIGKEKATLEQEIDNREDSDSKRTEEHNLGYFDVIKPRSHKSSDVQDAVEGEANTPLCTPYEVLTDKEQKNEENAEKSSDSALFVQDADGDTYLHLAIIQGKNDIAATLIRLMKHESLDIQNKQGQTPLHIAVYLQNHEMVKQLVHYGASVAVMDSSGDTPLHLACRTKLIDFVHSVMYGHSTMSETFGLHMALQTKNYNGESPLHVALEHALSSGNEEILVLLLKENSDMDIRENKTGKTCLFLALEKKNYKLANIFINSGANVNIATYSGCSPLHLASEYGNIDMITRLIEKGASLYAKNVELQTPKDVAASDEIKQLIEKALKKNRRSRQKQKQLQNLEKRIVNKFSNR